MLEISLSYQTSTMIRVNIHPIPGDNFSCTFDENKSFGDLKNELVENNKIKKGTYYFVMNDHVMNNHLILKDNSVTYNSDIYIIRNDCINIKLEVEDDEGNIHTKKKYAVMSDFKVIKSDENKEVKNDEIKRLIGLLKDESSDHLSILEDLCTLYDKFNYGFNEINKMFLEMDFLSSAIKIFEAEKESDKKSLLVLIVKKIYDGDYKKEGINLYKSMDAIYPLYYIMLGGNKEESFMWANFNIKTREDSIKLIVTIARKFPLDVIDDNNIKNSFKIILPSNKKYCEENKKYIYILFEELIKEGIIKKGEEGSEIIEEILYIAEMINKKKDIINVKEEVINEINNYIRIAKEKGFEAKVNNDKIVIIAEDIYDYWIKLFKEDDCCSYDNEEGIIKEEEKEKIKKFCDYVISHSFDIQMKFINKLYDIINFFETLPDELKYFNTNKNGLFQYIYLPKLFKIYHLEEILPMFIREMQDKCEDIPKCYEYIVELYNETIERMMKEEKEIEINEENVIVILFLWCAMIKEGKKEKEVEYLINSTIKILEWLGRIEEEEKKEKKEKEIKNEERKKENVNLKEIIILELINIIAPFSPDGLKKDKERMKKDGRICKKLLEIVKNHIKNERCLIQKGNKKRIIEYIIYSYYDEEFDTSDLLSISSHSFPFCHNTVICILDNINKYYINEDNKELLRKYISMYLIELLDNYIDVIKIIDECDIKKEIEKELLIEWNNNIINNIKKKILLYWRNMYNLVSPYIALSDLSSKDNENNNVFKRLINMHFYHCNNILLCNVKGKEMNVENIEEMKNVDLFLMDYWNRKDFIMNFIMNFADKFNYSIFNVYYLINDSEECSIINVLLKELSGEIVDIIEESEGSNILRERRRYERERVDEIFEYLLTILRDIMKYTFKDRNKVYLGRDRNKEEYKGKEKEIKEIKDYISDIIEEEDMKECLILFLKNIEETYDDVSDNVKYILSALAEYSNNTLYYLLSVNEFLYIKITDDDDDNNDVDDDNNDYDNYDNNDEDDDDNNNFFGDNEL